MAFYENVFIARQDLAQAQVDALADQFTATLKELGGEVKKREYWGLRSLSFRIKKNRKGHYVLFNIDAPAAAINEYERRMRINEDVLRYLTVRVDELEEGPSVMMRKSDRDERGERGDRGDRGDRSDLLAGVDLAGLCLDLRNHRCDRLVEAALDDHGVRTGGEVLEALGHNRLREDGGGGGAVTGDVVGLGRGFLEKLRAHVLERVGKLDLFGDGHAVMADGWCAVLLVDRNVAALWPKGRLDRFGQDVDTVLELAPGFRIESQLLRHGLSS